MTRYEQWLDGVHKLMTGFTDANLGDESYSDRYREREWKAAEILLHALDHTALHVGHMQVQRQLWEADRR
ncbi:MAG: hypothetical protein WKF63_09200 [Thermomicrobiales bacterium]